MNIDCTFVKIKNKEHFDKLMKLLVDYGFIPLFTKVPRKWLDVDKKEVNKIILKVAKKLEKSFKQ
jgi:hypothetical protein